MVESGRLTALAGEVIAGASFPDGPAVIALSGGADSAVLAWIALQSGVRCRAVHIHHGWPASDLLQRSAEAVAAELGLPMTVVHVTPGSGPSPEGMARTARYRALGDALEGDEWLLTGHTLDDQAETVVANLLRGSGLDGLRGMRPHRDRLARPLLSVRRADVRELAVMLELPFRDDPSNLDVSLRRSYLRLRFLGPLEESVAPGTSVAIARMAALVGDDLDYLEHEAARRAPDPSVAPILASLPPALARRAARRYLRQIGLVEGGTAADVEKVVRVAVESGRVELSGGVSVVRDGVRLQVDRGSGPAVAARSWNLRGLLDWSPEWSIEGHVDEAPPPHYSLSSWSEVFDADEMPDEVVVRPVGADDRIRLRNGSKSVVEALAEAGIGRDRRPQWPVLAVGRDVLWVPGVRRAFTGWVRSDTRRYLCLSAVVEAS